MKTHQVVNVAIASSFGIAAFSGLLALRRFGELHKYIRPVHAGVYSSSATLLALGAWRLLPQKNERLPSLPIELDPSNGPVTSSSSSSDSPTDRQNAGPNVDWDGAPMAALRARLDASPRHFADEAPFGCIIHRVLAAQPAERAEWMPLLHVVLEQSDDVRACFSSVMGDETRLFERLHLALHRILELPRHFSPVALRDSHGYDDDWHVPAASAVWRQLSESNFTGLSQYRPVGEWPGDHAVAIGHILWSQHDGCGPRPNEAYESAINRRTYWLFDNFTAVYRSQWRNSYKHHQDQADAVAQALEGVILLSWACRTGGGFNVDYDCLASGVHHIVHGLPSGQLVLANLARSLSTHSTSESLPCAPLLKGLQGSPRFGRTISRYLETKNASAVLVALKSMPEARDYILNSDLDLKGWWSIVLHTHFFREELTTGERRRLIDRLREACSESTPEQVIEQIRQREDEELPPHPDDLILGALCATPQQLRQIDQLARLADLIETGEVPPDAELCSWLGGAAQAEVAPLLRPCRDNPSVLRRTIQIALQDGTPSHNCQNLARYSVTEGNAYIVQEEIERASRGGISADLQYKTRWLQPNS